jgi:hypothetical protein
MKRMRFLRLGMLCGKLRVESDVVSQVWGVRCRRSVL